MNKLIAVAALAVLASSASAQLSPLPPSSATDGVFSQGIGANAGASHWESLSGLGAYRFASDTNLNTPNMGNPDNILGLNWSTSVNAQVSSIMSNLQANGGTVRVIFLGESSGWLNDFGYTYSGHPQGADSYTVYQNIQSLAPATIAFGDNFEVQLNPGDANSFDLWLNGVGEMGPANPSPTENGGTYTVFHPSNSVPYLAPGNVRWAQSALSVSTWNVAQNDYALTSTFLVGLEDWRLDRHSDKDYNDYAFALQFLDKDGNPFSPVPEPSTYGLIGAIALLGLVARRRFARK
jgi:hypothetical protein